MRSYYAHLETTVPSKISVNKPVFRASAIFPVFHVPNITSRIVFMGYWILKRNIQQIAAVVTLRSLEGQILIRDNFVVNEPKTFRIELQDLMNKAGLPVNSVFMGSMEIEFFSSVPLFFPFPAVAINYYGPAFSTIVHTAQRVYNDYDDMKANSQTSVPESGFNVYVDDNHEPFIGLINGPVAVPEGKVLLQFVNKDKELLTHELNLGKIEPYQTHFIYPAQHVDLKTFLKDMPGAAKVKFNVNWIFPRLLVGNTQTTPAAISITHTYYDCRNATSDSDYWLPIQPEWHAAALMLPLMLHQNHFTNIYFYPIYSPATFAISLEIYDKTGNKLAEQKDALTLTGKDNDYFKLDLETICKKLKIDTTQDLAIKIMARPIDSNRIPSRIKLGFDIGLHTEPKMPCNICTNLQPFNPSLENKPSTFHWSPILADQPHTSLWIHNSSPAVNYMKKAKVTVTFFHEKDAQSITRELILPPHGTTVIRSHEDPELNAFFDGTIGWCTIVSDNPYTTAYYFAENASGVVGGDHCF